MGEMSSLGVIHVELVVTTRSPWKVIKKDWGGRGVGARDEALWDTSTKKEKRSTMKFIYPMFSKNLAEK